MIKEKVNEKLAFEITLHENDYVIRNIDLQLNAINFAL